MKALMKPVTVPPPADCACRRCCSAPARAARRPRRTRTCRPPAQAAVYTGPAPAAPTCRRSRPICGSTSRPATAAAAATRPAASRRCSRAPTTSIRPTAPRSRSSICRSPIPRLMVQKVAGGHNCWLSSPQACADILTTWISNWAGGGSGSAGRHADPADRAAVDRRSARPRCFRPTRRCSAPRSIRWCSSAARAAIPILRRRRSRRTSPAATWRRPTLRRSRRSTSIRRPIRRFYIRLAQQSHNCWGNPVELPGQRRRHAGGDPGVRQRHPRHAGRSDAGRLARR